MEKILLAIDGSAPSIRATEKASELARCLGAEILVFHVREWGPLPAVALQVVGSMELESRNEATELVDGVVRDLKDAGISARGEIRDATTGQAPKEILQVARSFDADIIVMGSRGRSDLAGLVLGSVTHKVLHLTDRPILVVR